MNRDEISAWMARYQRAWETQDTERFVSLFTADGRYLDRPFTPPVDARDFRQMWTELATRQADNQFEWDILAVEGHLAFVHWHAHSTRVASNERREGDGIFMLTFEAGPDSNADWRCRELREWQHWRVVEA